MVTRSPLNVPMRTPTPMRLAHGSSSACREPGSLRQFRTIVTALLRPSWRTTFSATHRLGEYSASRAVRFSSITPRARAA
jgi:hypothetical protein